MPIYVAIVEDDKHYNQALKKIIDFDSELECVGQFYSAREAEKHLVEQDPDVVLMDIKLPDKTGIELVAHFSGDMPETRFIMCTSFEDDAYVYDALRAGAVGYLTKGETMDKIIAAIKESYQGGAPMSSNIARKVISFFHQVKENLLQQLTKTESEVLELLATGMSYQQIADKKFVSLDTIKKHICNIYRKLHVNNKIEAINLLTKNHKL